MALFENGQKRSLWGNNKQRSYNDRESNSLSLTDSGAEYEKDFHEIEGRLRNTISDGQLADDAAYAKSLETLDYKADRGMANSGRLRMEDHDHNDYSYSAIDLVVPGWSTMELQAVIQIRKLPQPWLESLMRDRKESHTSSDPIITGKDPRSDSQSLRTKQVIVKAPRQLFPAAIQKLIDGYLESGKARAAANLLGSARFYMLKACLIAELTPSADPVQVKRTQFKYAKFLLKHGCTSAALQITEWLSYDLSTNAFKSRDMSVLNEKIRMRLAALYLELRRFSAAQDLYIKAFGDQLGHGTNINLIPSAAHCLERVA